MEKAKVLKWQIWRQILSDLHTYLHQISSDAAWHTYLPKNLTSYVNAPQAFVDDLSDYEDWQQYSNNELDGCYHVFIDVGSNIGNTVRNTTLIVQDLIHNHYCTHYDFFS